MEVQTNFLKNKRGKHIFKRKWLVLIGYCVLSMANGSTATAFPAVSNILQKYYRIEPIKIHALLGVYSAVMIFFLPVFSYLLHRYELACVIKIAATLNLMGGIIRFFGDTPEYGYYFLLLGNFVCAISMSAYMFLPPKIAENWFHGEEMGRVNGFCIGSDMVATALGFIHATQTVRSNTKNDMIRHGIKKLVTYQLVMAAVAAILNWLFVKSQPRRAAHTKKYAQQPEEMVLSGKQQKITKEAKTLKDFFKNVKVLFKNQEFLLIAHLSSIAYTNELLLSMLLNDLTIVRFPGTETQIGIIGFTAIILGFFSNFLAGYTVDKTNAYRKVTVATFMLSLLFLVMWLSFLLTFDSFVSIAISFCVFFVINVSYYSTAATHVIVATPNVPPGITSMVTLMATVIYAPLFGFAGSLIWRHTNNWIISVYILIIQLLACLLSLCLRGTCERVRLNDILQLEHECDEE